MITRLSPAKKLLIIVAVQLLVLLSVIGFKQYVIWTSETILLKTTVTDTRNLLSGDFAEISYAISTIDLDEVAGDDQYGGEVFVELQRGDDGYWFAVAVHGRGERTFDGTVLVRGDAGGFFDDALGGWRPTSSGVIRVRYDIEQIFVPEGSAAALPTGSGHVVAVQVRVDRFGDAVPEHFVVDDEPFALKRR